MTDTTPSAYLWVTAEPGQQVKTEEFHDWYDNEHIPLRMNHLPEFLTGARYEAVDGAIPSWSANYEISTMSLFDDERYTSLRTSRSPRETTVVTHLEILDRRTCQFIYDSGSTGKPAPFLLTVAATPAEGTVEDFHAWYNDEHLALLAKVPGWRRTLRYQVVDSLKTSVGKDPVSGGSPQFVAIYEFDNGDYPTTQELKDATTTAWAKKHMGGSLALEVRRWKLSKSFESLAVASS